MSVEDFKAVGGSLWVGGSPDKYVILLSPLFAVSWFALPPDEELRQTGWPTLLHNIPSDEVENETEKRKTGTDIQRLWPEVGEISPVRLPLQVYVSSATKTDVSLIRCGIEEPDKGCRL